MLTISELHEKAMSFAEEAFIAKRNRELDKATDLYCKAFFFETEAANLVANNYDAEPTRSILYRSAASLAMLCFKYEEAERHISNALAGAPPLEIKEELLGISARLNMIIDIRHFDDNSLSEWFLYKFNNKEANCITELSYIFDFLNQELQFKYKSSLAKASSISLLTNNDMEVIKMALKIATFVKADEVIDTIIQKIADGLFTLNNNVEDKEFIDSILDIIKIAPSNDNGVSRIKKLITSPYFKSFNATSAFFALSYIDPFDYHKHLRLLREHFYDMHTIYSVENNTDIEISEFLSILGTRIEIIANNLQHMQRPSVLTSIIGLDDYWFFKLLFIGDESPLCIDNIDNKFIIKKRGHESFQWDIKTPDPQSLENGVCEYIEFTKFLSAHLCRRKIPPIINITDFPVIAKILKQSNYIFPYKNTKTEQYGLVS